MPKQPTMTQSLEQPVERTTTSRRKRARLDRLLGEVMDSITIGERRIGNPDAPVRLSTSPRRKVR